MQQNVLAIVARVANYRDNDRVLTLITRDKGCMTVSARGCRKAQSKLLACSQPFCYGDYELYTRNSHEYVRQCGIREIFYELRLRPDTFEAAAYACSICEMLAVPGEAFLRGFSLLLYTLKALCESTCNVDSVLAFFLLKQMDFAGLRPQAQACVGCGVQQDLTGFDAQCGGVVCARCQKTTLGCVTISPPVLAALRDLPDVPSASLAQVCKAIHPLSPQLLALMEEVFVKLTGQTLKKRMFIHWQDQLYNIK